MAGREDKSNLPAGRQGWGIAVPVRIRQLAEKEGVYPELAEGERFIYTLPAGVRWQQLSQC
ncbi:MAG: hypothetical protein UT26_C0058G0010 [Microgenomates group bacterium GW2011_GWC1_39_12]|nr:MAG: hypothetical protein UT26_C0058G0010 [Microgenomates group bacterium GW2011_GWC1_39_12]